MLPRVVADSNILISAFYRGGKAQRVLELAEAGAIDLYLSQFILDEVAGVLSLKFNWDAQSILEALGTLSTRPSTRVRLGCAACVTLPTTGFLSARWQRVPSTS